MYDIQVRYVTYHIQKDKRITLGTCVHKYKDCPSLKDRNPVEISGHIVQILPKCNYCYERQNKTK
jgi:hypothetical protein